MTVTACSLDIQTVLELNGEAYQRLEKVWRERLIERLACAMDREIRGDAPAKPPSTEAAAMVLMRGAGVELEAAAVALDRAAEVLAHKAHLGVPAHATHSAAKRAHAAAQELLG